jgi:hypothetical protein
MAQPPLDARNHWSSSWTTWLERPLAGWTCVLGWCAATAVQVLGGPSTVDSIESVYSTWAIAHGHFACAFPGDAAHGSSIYVRPPTYIAPLYPIISGAIAAVTRIGSNVPFPSTAELGPHCSTALPAMYQWSERAKVLAATDNLGYVGWFFLMAGVVAFLRSVGRGRSRWEPLTLILVACLPPVWSAIETAFHPEDLVAMGLLLGGVACAMKRWWAWAGILLALAMLSQQFALLVAAPLFVIAPRPYRFRYSIAGIGTAVVIVVPLLALGSGRGLRAITLGSSQPFTGHTLVAELGLEGWLLTSISRVFPVVLSMLLAWWLIRRLGAATVLTPLPLSALIALSLSLRLVLEENLRVTYYFMALAVALVLLDVVRGQIRGAVWAWVALVTVSHDVWPVGMFSEVHWGFGATEHLPQVLMVLGLCIILVDVVRSRVRWYIVAWLAVIVTAFATWPFTSEPFRTQLPIWLWQLLLVPTGIWLAAEPLARFVRDRDERQTRSTSPSTDAFGSNASTDPLSPSKLD